MPIKFTFIIFGLIASFATSAQSSVMCLGTSVCDKGGSLSYSVGQLETNLVSSDQYNLSEGVHQIYPLVESQQTGNRYYIFPNPTVDLVHVWPDNPEVTISYFLYNDAGQLVTEKRCSNEVVINMADLPSGCYILHAISGNSRNAVYKIIRK